MQSWRLNIEVDVRRHRIWHVFWEPQLMRVVDEWYMALVLGQVIAPIMKRGAIVLVNIISCRL